MGNSIMHEATEYVRDKDAGFRYQLLSRMESDCRYYLGNGRLYGHHLWAGNEAGQIAYMKALWHSFPIGKKPDWLSLEDILAYEKRLDPRYKLQQDALNKIAEQLDVAVWYPVDHSDPLEKNPVLFYLKPDYKENQAISAKAEKPSLFYHQPGKKLFRAPFLCFENTDANDAMSYDFAFGGRVDLRSENWADVLLNYIKQVLTEHLQSHNK